MKTINLNRGRDVEVIPSVHLALMEFKRLARDKQVTVIEVKPRPWVLRLVGKVALIGAGLIFSIGLLIWWAKGLPG
jgi:predicted ATP-grasp superfamily ATP-dependent carboligase